MLAQHFTVVATDLRGYGDSSKPADGKNHEGYSKRTMAKDQVAVMSELGFDRFLVVGHDRGARVAHRMALDYPEKVVKACRTRYLYHVQNVPGCHQGLCVDVLPLVLPYSKRADSETLLAGRGDFSSGTGRFVI